MTSATEEKGKIHIQESICLTDSSKSNTTCGIMIAGSQAVIKQCRHEIPDSQRCQKCYSRVGDSYE